MEIWRCDWRHVAKGCTALVIINFWVMNICELDIRMNYKLIFTGYVQRTYMSKQWHSEYAIVCTAVYSWYLSGQVEWLYFVKKNKVSLDDNVCMYVTLLLSSPTKYLNFFCPLIASTPRHLHTHLLLLQTSWFLHFQPSFSIWNPQGSIKLPQ